VWLRLPIPLFLGGVEVSHRMLAEDLAAAGHVVYFVGSLKEPYVSRTEVPIALVRALDNARVGFSRTHLGGFEYMWKGVRCLAVPPSELDRTLQRLVGPEMVDVVVSAHEGSATVLRRMRPQTLRVGWVHSSSPAAMEVLEAKPDRVLATSMFAASTVMKHAAPQHLDVFYPPFRESTSTMGSAGGYVTMVNPIPSKGARLFYEIAQLLPEVQFLAQMGWYRPEKRDLENVTYRSRTDDINTVIRRTRVILVPSLRPEGFGRVAVEFGLAGVPALSTPLGGLTEAVPKECQVRSRDANEWTARLLRLVNEPEYGRMSDICTRHSQWFLRDHVKEFLSIVGRLP
jgi:glycosyltransferase involved in cell wall biosynthesis